MKVAYLVSRFPHVSETFIAREIAAVAAGGEVEVEILSLFGPVSDVVHPVAAPLLARHHRPTMAEAAAASIWWAGRRPLRLLGCVAAVVRAYAHRPRLLARALATLPLAAAHARRLRAAEVDRLHAHYASYPTLAAWLCHRLTGIGYGFTVHAHDIFVDQSLLPRKVADADFVVAISEFDREFLVPYGGGGATPVEVVHCGIEVGLYEFRPHPIAASGPVDALCVASLQEYKGHAVLFDAVARRPALDRLRLTLVGEGVLREELEVHAEALGIADRVQFLGALSEDEVRRRMDEADLFVLPSIVAADGQMEGLPVSLIEALACGLTCVATSLSGIPELIRDGETGLLARPGDADDLARALVDAIDADPIDPAQGRALVRAEFDIRLTARRMVELFGQFVKTSG
jgi:colanic acid/amylovoran biosynthesis glycosyltransferase